MRLWELCCSDIPDDKVVGVDLWAAAAVEEDARVADDGAAAVVLVLHRGDGGQQAVEVLRDVGSAVSVKHVVDDVSGFV